MVDSHIFRFTHIYPGQLDYYYIYLFHNLSVNILNLGVRGKLRGSESEGDCLQAWRPEFSHQESHSEKQKLASEWEFSSHLHKYIGTSSRTHIGK